MREILFRGKTFITKKMVMGTGILYDGTNTWIVNNEPPNALAFGMECYTVILETIGQYTGLTDKNGKKIFEGDIVIWCGIKGIVVWEGHKFYIKSNLLWDFSDDDCIEVIGNIHDNPELLKE